MSNPAVIELVSATLYCGEYRIEDNLGEAIHFHLSDFRIDLSINEFHELAIRCMEILNVFCEKSNFDCSSIDPIFLFDIATYLPDLIKVGYRKVYLSELKLFTNNNTFKIPRSRKINESWVYKALQGDTREDDNRYQLGYYGCSNHERTILIDESIHANGYPWKNNYIVLFNEQTYIRDGQHRAASLYNIDKNQHIEVMVLYFENNKHNIPKHPQAHYFFCWNIKRVRGLCRTLYYLLKNIFQKVLKKIDYTLFRIPKTFAGLYVDRNKISTFWNSINKSSVNCVLIKNIANELPENLPNGKDIDILVKESCQKEFQLIMKKMGYNKCIHPLGKLNGWRFLYKLPEYEFWKLKDKDSELYIDASFKLCCKGLMPKTWIPLDNLIQNRIWKDKVWDAENGWWILDTETRLVYLLVRCIFDKKIFSDKYIKEIEQTIEEADMQIVRELLNMIFFKYTDKLLYMVGKKQYSNIIQDYISFSEY
jgi:hypothetical protein